MSGRVVELALAAVLFVTGVIHLIPTVGVLSAQRLHALYGVRLDDPVTTLLLRHRALLFALLGTAFIAAAFTPGWRVIGASAALFCTLSFVLLARGDLPLPAEVMKVVRTDVVLSLGLSLALAAGLALHLMRAG